MAKNHVSWGFNYLSDKNGINILNGTTEETDHEIDVNCYDGIAILEIMGKFYKITYPKFQSLTDNDRRDIESYCGYIPADGEYGVILGALGQVEEISNNKFNEIKKTLS